MLYSFLTNEWTDPNYYRRWTQSRCKSRGIISALPAFKLEEKGKNDRLGKGKTERIRNGITRVIGTKQNIIIVTF